MQFGADVSVGGVVVNAVHLVRVGEQVVEFVFVEVVEVDEFVLLGADAVVPADTVPAGVFVVVVVETLTPIGGGFALHERQEALALHVIGLVDACGLEECLCDIQVRDDGLIDGPGFDNAGPACDEGSFQGGFVHPSLVVPAVLAEVPALVGAVDDEGVFCQACLVEIIQHASDVVVDRRDAAEVVLDVALIFPINQVVALEVGITKRLVFRLICGLPGGELFVGHALGCVEFEVVIVEVFGDGHFLHARCGASAIVVIEKRVGRGDGLIVVEGEVVGAWSPGAVRCFVLEHEDEGFVFIAFVVEPIQCEVCDDVGGVALDFDGRAVVDHAWVVVESLADQDVPVVKAGGVGFEVPLADHGGVVAGVFEEFDEGLLAAVEGVFVGVEAVAVAVFPGEDGGSAGSADGVGDQAVVEAHALVGDAVDVGCLVDL